MITIVENIGQCGLMKPGSGELNNDNQWYQM